MPVTSVIILALVIGSVAATQLSMNKFTQGNQSGIPLGTIMAWVPSPDGAHPVSLLPGWVICDGRVIEEKKSIWYGQHTPNLTERFLCGGESKNVLKFQEDQMQDHQHVDNGHSHKDSGHKHDDQGHSHKDAGHTHTYTDETMRARGKICAGRYWARNTLTKTTGTGYANIQSGKASISTSYAQISSAKSGLGGVVSGARYGSETRPKSAYIVWIMKVADIA